MSLSADAAGGKTEYRSSADACGRGRYFWKKQKCLRTHISLLQWWASIATAATMSRRNWGRAVGTTCEVLARLQWSLRCTVKVSVHIVHVNFNFPFKLGPTQPAYYTWVCIIIKFFLRYNYIALYRLHSKPVPAEYVLLFWLGCMLFYMW